jgi:hypothetical protein
MSSSLLTVNVFDGARQPMGDTPILFNIADGRGNRVVQQRDFPSGQTFELPFYDNEGDNYTVVVYADGYEQAGFMPVKCSPDAPQTLELMLIGKHAGFNFAKWDILAATDTLLHDILAHGAGDEAAGGARYAELMESQPKILACLFNITTAMAAIQLPVGNPLQYFRELIWDGSMAQDRFYGWADPALYAQVVQAAQHGEFSREPGFAAFHHGATDSYKQIQFGEANVQLTFHADDKKVIDGTECIKMEPDIDYYKDLLAHALLEVITNGISGNLTDPRQVYVLRWIAGRHAGVPEFKPPYVIA